MSLYHLSLVKEKEKTKEDLWFFKRSWYCFWTRCHLVHFRSHLSALKNTRASEEIIILDSGILSYLWARYFPERPTGPVFMKKLRVRHTPWSCENKHQPPEAAANLHLKDEVISIEVLRRVVTSGEICPNRREKKQSRLRGMMAEAERWSGTSGTL